MKRQLLDLRRGDSTCCPGHDKFPDQTYANNRSKRARAKSKADEHQLVRSILKRSIPAEMKDVE